MITCGEASITLEAEGIVAYNWPWLGPFWNRRQHSSVVQIPLRRRGPQFCVCQVLCNVCGLEASATWVWCAFGSHVHVDWLVFLRVFLVTLFYGDWFLGGGLFCWVLRCLREWAHLFFIEVCWGFCYYRSGGMDFGLRLLVNFEEVRWRPLSC